MWWTASQLYSKICLLLSSWLFCIFALLMLIMHVHNDFIYSRCMWPVYVYVVPLLQTLDWLTARSLAWVPSRSHAAMQTSSLKRPWGRLKQTFKGPCCNTCFLEDWNDGRWSNACGNWASSSDCLKMSCETGASWSQPCFRVYSDAD